MHHLMDFTRGLWRLNPGLHACNANTLLTKPSSRAETKKKSLKVLQTRQIWESKSAIRLLKQSVPKNWNIPRNHAGWKERLMPWCQLEGKVPPRKRSHAVLPVTRPTCRRSWSPGNDDSVMGGTTP
ncbi:hypothetical protein LEMLEM_LOCUS26538 [Lemmus lemmus]